MSDENDELNTALAEKLGIESDVEETPDVDPEEEASGEGDLLYDDLPANIKERAEALEVDPSLFYDATVTLSDGTVMTLGELKDYRQEREQADSGMEALHVQQEQFQREQQVAQAQAQLGQKYNQPLSKANYIRSELIKQRDGADWRSLQDQYGDKAEIKRLQLDRQISEVENDIRVMNGEYQQEVGGFNRNVQDSNINAIAAMHPEWETQEQGIDGLKNIHAGLGGQMTFDQFIRKLVMSPNGAADLPYFEQASKYSAVSNMDENKVRKAAKGLKSGKTITASQQQKMQARKAIKAARGGSRRTQNAAAEALIKQAGGI